MLAGQRELERFPVESLCLGSELMPGNSMESSVQTAGIWGGERREEREGRERERERREKEEREREGNDVADSGSETFAWKSFGSNLKTSRYFDVLP